MMWSGALWWLTGLLAAGQWTPVDAAVTYCSGTTSGSVSVTDATTLNTLLKSWSTYSAGCKGTIKLTAGGKQEAYGQSVDLSLP